MARALLLVMLLICGSIPTFSVTTSTTIVDSTTSTDAPATITDVVSDAQNTVTQSSTSASTSAPLSTSSDSGDGSSTQSVPSASTTEAPLATTTCDTDYGDQFTTTEDNDSSCGPDQLQDFIRNIANLICCEELPCISLRLRNDIDLRDSPGNWTCPCSCSDKSYYLETTHGGKYITARSEQADKSQGCRSEEELGITALPQDGKQDDEVKHERVILAACLSFVGGMAVIVFIIVLRKMRVKKQCWFRGEEEEAKAYWEGASNRVTTKVLLKHSLQRERPDMTVNPNPNLDSSTKYEPESKDKEAIQPEQKAADPPNVQPAYKIIVDTPEVDVKDDVNDLAASDTGVKPDKGPDNDANESTTSDTTVEESDSAKADEQKCLSDTSSLTVDSAKLLPDSSRLNSELYEMDRDSVRGSSTSQVLLTIQNEVFAVNNDAEF